MDGRYLRIRAKTKEHASLTGPVFCSFCDTINGLVKLMIRGPEGRVFICDTCVLDCMAMIEAMRVAKQDPLFIEFTDKES